MACRVFCFAITLTMLGVTALEAAPLKELQAALTREIVGPVLPAAEIQRYCEARVPRMSNYASVRDWDAEAARLRTAVLEKVVFRGEAVRWRDAVTRVEWLGTIPGGPGYHIKKLRYEALPGLWIPALLYEPDKLSGKVPVIMNVNGHERPLGKAVPYKQLRCINQAKRGMLALNVEWLGMGQLFSDGFSHTRMNQLDLCGTSGLAPFYLSMQRGLDLLLSLPNADPQRVAVTGLSGGGWQTIFISALDTRVKLAAPVAGYSSFLTRAAYPKDLGDPEQTPCDLATVADYLHLTAMRAPRPTLLINNAKDNCCFASGYALPPLLDAARPIFRLYGCENALRWHVNDDPGTHNYEVDNRQAFYRALGDFFYPDDKQFDAREIDSTKEVKSKKDLDVELPAHNEDFNSLALALAEPLPLCPPWRLAPAVWQRGARSLLRDVVRAKDYEVLAIKGDSVQTPSLTTTSWRLQLGGAWTVPAVEMSPPHAQATAVLLADEGRRSATVEAARLLSYGYRVIAVDPLGIGESAVPKYGWLWDLFIAAVGDRPLGVQASQVAAIARWTRAEHREGLLAVVGLGPRSSTIALVAAALEVKAIDRVELHQPLGSFKEVIEQNWGSDRTPELFCFGLLKAFDVRQIGALVAPRVLVTVGASARAKAELGELTSLYRTLGGVFEPLK
jgi:dienelactone hydrolase